MSNALFNPKFGSTSLSDVSDFSITNLGSSGLDKYKNFLKTLYNLINLKIKSNMSSVSRKQLILEISGKTKISCDLKRHLSPRTVGTILRSLPLEGNSHLLGKSIVYFETSVDSGIERAKSEFKKGDIAFLPSTGSFCFFVNNVESAKTMTLIGKFTDELNQLNNVKPGDVLRLYEDTT